MSAWPRTRLGDVLSQVVRPEAIDASKEYRTLGVRWYGGGLFVKDALLGHQIAAPKLHAVQEGDFIYNRLFAWKGSFAVAGREVEGCYVSNEFPCFAVRAEVVSADFLRWLFRRESTWAWALGLSTGATPTSRNRLKEEAFLSLEVQLPSLVEQRRLVALIDEVAEQVSRAEAVEQEISSDTERLLVAMAHRADLTDSEKEARLWSRVRLADVLLPEQQAAKVMAGEKYPNFGIYSFGKGLFEKPPIDGLASSAATLNRVRRGQFIYSRLFAFEGAYGMVDDRFDGFFVSNEYPTFRCDPKRLLPEFLVAYMKPQSMWVRIAAGSKGLGDRRQRVQPAQLLGHELWLPPLPEQQRLAAVMREVADLSAARSARRAELAALLPAVLNSAFAGAL